MQQTSAAVQAVAVPTARNYLLDVTNRQIGLDDLTRLEPLFVHAGLPTDVHCQGIDPDYDGYNPTPVVRVKVHAGDQVLTPVVGIRTERRREPYRAETRFCRYDPFGACVELSGVARKPWEDPHMVVLPGGRVVAYGVYVDWAQDESMEFSSFWTEFYVGESLDSLRYLGRSPAGHKDSRVIVGNDGQLGLYTRPQQRPQEGKIAYVPLEDINELEGNAEAVYRRARLIGQGIFGDGTWGGPNHPIDIGDGWHMVKCHAATLLANGAGGLGPDMVYSAFMLFHHPVSGRAFAARPHANADEFPHADEYKWQKVRQVVFPGGLYDLEIAETGKLSATAIYGLRDTTMVTQHLESLVPFAPLLAV